MEKLIKDYLLTLDLQHFSEKDEPPTDKDDVDPSAETKKPDDIDDKSGSKDDIESKHVPYGRFKDKVDEVNQLKAKLKEIEDAEAEEKRKELVEQNKYKELYEETLKTLAAEQAAKLNLRKDSLLTSAGYSDEQAKVLRKLVEGDTDEEISESIEKLKATFPVKRYTDPNPGNGERGKPEGKDASEDGRNAIKRLIQKGKLRGVSDREEA